MATRSSARGRTASRSSRSGRTGSGTSTQQAIFIGAGAVVVLVILIVVLGGGSGSGGPANAGTSNKPAPAAAPTPPPAAPAQVPAGKAKAGKPPKTPAPPLTQETLAELSSLLSKAKAVYNEGVTALNAGDSMAARAKKSEAHEILDAWKNKIEAPLRWQEDAQMEDWAQPAEYEALERLYADYQSLSKKVRMGGG